MAAFLRGFGGLLLAFLTLYYRSQVLPNSFPYPDGFLIFVVYYAITRSQIPATLVGVAAGLVEDSLSWPFGINALTKTTIGYFVSGLGSRFLLNQPLPQFLILFAATGVEEILERIFLVLIGQSFLLPSLLPLAEKGLLNAALGVLVFRIVDRLLRSPS